MVGISWRTDIKVLVHPQPRVATQQASHHRRIVPCQGSQRRHKVADARLSPSLERQYKLLQLGTGHGRRELKERDPPALGIRAT
eukprot:3116031-Prymnesium_polylepis.2